MKSLCDCRLYAFVDLAYLRGRVPSVVAQQLCDGGADLIQLRAKDASLEDICHLGEQILAVTRRAGVGLVINDHPAIAAELGAEVCHLGQGDFFERGHRHVSEVRSLSPVRSPGAAPLRIGLSTHAPAQAQRALVAGADYVAIGPVYATGTKPGATPVTLEYLRWAAANLTVPWFAIGGINLQNVPEVLAAGATRICVVAAILNAKDIAGECRKFVQALPR
jgi:thiamine-phosphate pyrophosphorylase